MDVFGENWVNHVEMIETAWNACVEEDDTVLVVGDTDWALHLEDALSTLWRIETWTGRKLLVRGNHDYWWSSKATNRVRRSLPPTIRVLHNEAIEIEGFNIIGLKGSAVPGAAEWGETEVKLLNRETERLKLSLAHRDVDRPTVCAVHYPPFYPATPDTPYWRLLQDSDCRLCVYGHLHGAAARSGPYGVWDDTIVRLVAADFLEFKPALLVADGRVLAPPPPPGESW